MPWLLFWVLVGNTPVLIAALVALAVAIATILGSRAQKQSTGILAIGAGVTFAILLTVPVLASYPFTERWILALSNAGLLIAALISVLVGKSVIETFVTADQPAAVVQSELFAPAVARLTWIWLAAFAGMTLSSVVPPLVLADATLLDSRTPLAFGCYWVLPLSLLATAAIVSRVVLDRMTAGFGDAVRKTSFVAFVDLEIDQLHYLAREHANREVGPGQEAYNVTVGAKATPLLGDETRVSWPSTFKVRERRGAG